MSSTTTTTTSDVNYELLGELKSAREEEASENSSCCLRFSKTIELHEQPIRGIYIRACYRRLVELIINNDSDFVNNRRRAPSCALILGDPGMGKTFFSYYFMHTLMTRNTDNTTPSINIVYDCGENRHVYSYAAKTGRVSHTNEDAEKLLRSPEHAEPCWYVVDGCEPRLAGRDLRARIILLCTFRKQNYHAYEKLFLVNRYYMPRWSFDELRTCKQTFFETLSDEQLRKLHDKFGPVPRYVLAKAHQKSIHSLLDESINRFDLESTMFNYGELDEFETISDVVHMNVDERTFENRGIVFTSDYVARRVVEKHLARHEELVKRALRLSMNSEFFVGVRVILFRAYAFDRLAKGGQFKITDADSKQDRVFSMPSREKRYYATPDDITNEKDYQRYLWICESLSSSSSSSSSSNRESISGFMYPNYYFHFGLNDDSHSDADFTALIRHIGGHLTSSPSHRVRATHRNGGCLFPATSINFIRIIDSKNRSSKSHVITQLDLNDDANDTDIRDKIECYNFSILLDF